MTLRATSAAKLVLGTMRMRERKLSAEAWADYFAYAYAAGVRRMHCSSEYDSYPLFRQSIAALAARHPAARFEYMVKLADPSFSEADFDGGRLSERIKKYCVELGVTRIADVQWMWRGSLEDDDRRCQAFLRSLPTIQGCVDSLKERKWIGRFLCFPYTPKFATLAAESACVDGIVIYRNPLELDYEEHVQQCDAAGKGVVVIRPFAAGRLFSDAAVTGHKLLEFATQPSAVDGVVATISSPEHLESVLG